jgi:hypothetical protein
MYECTGSIKSLTLSEKAMHRTILNSMIKKEKKNCITYCV